MLRDRWTWAGLAVSGVLLGSVGGCVVRQAIVPKPAAPVQSAIFGDRDQRRNIDSLADPGQPSPRATLRSIDYAALARECGEGCSDYDLGMLGAERAGITAAEQCMEYTWSYQRGCLAFLSEGHRRPPPA